MSKLTSLAHTDEKNSALGTADLLSQRIKERLLENQNPEHSIQFLLQDYIDKGLFEKAEETIQSINWSDINENKKAALLSLKLRNLAVQGRWEEAVMECSQIMSQGPVAHLRLTALNLRAICLYELGDFKAARRDIEAIYDFSYLYPHCEEWISARCLEAKIFGLEKKFPRAEFLLKETINELRKTEKLTVDHLLNFMRTNLELRRQQGQDYRQVAKACYHMARSLNDKFYQDWARIELNLLDGGDSAISSTTFPVFERFANSSNDTDRPLTTGLQWKKVKPTADVSDSDLQVSPERIIFSKWSIVLDLTTNKLEYIKFTKRTQSILHAISCGNNEKSQLFKHAWEMKTYRPHLHNQIIYVSVGRIRNELGINLRINDNHANVEGSLIA